MWLPNSVVDSTLKACRVFYLDKNQVLFWNEKRGDGDPLVFTGCYWAKGATSQGGPFKSQSACIRDAWYSLVMRMAPPSLSRGVTKMRVVSETATAHHAKPASRKTPKPRDTARIVPLREAPNETQVAA